MRVVLQANPSDLAAPDCHERAHSALRDILAKAGSPGLAKGGEVDALEELASLTGRRVDARLRAMATAARVKL